MVLERAGFQVVCARDGKVALEMARREPPDVILADILMPGMDGFQLCLEVRLDSELRAIPYVLHTASFLGEEDRAFAFKLGADGYIEKDASAEELRALLVDVVEGRGGSAADRREGGPLDERSFRGQYGERLLSRLVEEAAELQRANEALAAAYDATLEALVAALDLRDTETEFHSWRVAEYACAVARRLGLEGRRLAELERGSILHDIGKIGIPDQILRKPGPLSEDEWLEMRKHPLLGYEMIAHVDFLSEAAQIILAHHERWDGGGYPRGLRAEAIPLGARIFAVADAVDAMTSNRPYRAAQDLTSALEEIKRMSGSQFDPAVVEAAQSLPLGEWQALKDHVELRRGGARSLRAGARRRRLAIPQAPQLVSARERG